MTIVTAFLQEIGQEELLSEIIARLEKVGDLPIFSASVNRVQLVGSDPDSDAMMLAAEILKDANLATRVLKLANSTYYNRGTAKIGGLTRAVVRLGFDTLKSSVLTMKLIDSFKAQNPELDLTALLVGSYMSAGFVRELTAECGAKESEQSYVCGLLHNIGEIVVACTMPQKYQETKRLMEEKRVSWSQAQNTVLGLTLRNIGQRIVEKWEFPESVTKTMTTYVPRKSQGLIRDKIELNRSLASLSQQMMDLLYAEHPVTNMQFKDLRGELSKVTGVNLDVIARCLDKTYRQSCDLAQEYGLDKRTLLPRMRANCDDEELLATIQHLRQEVNQTGERTADVVVADDDGYDAEPQEVSDLDSIELDDKRALVGVQASVGDANTLLAVLHDLTTMISQKKHINSVFNKILEGMHRGVGFDRAMLCLLSADHGTYAARMVQGRGADKLKSFFAQLPVRVDSDVFSSVIMRGEELQVNDVHKGWLNMLPYKFVEKLQTTAFIVGAVWVKNRPIGLFYADKHQQKTPISVEENRNFTQLVAQAMLALQVR